MARERDRHPPDPRRIRPGALDSPPDPIGRLEEVLEILGQMLEDRGVAPPPHRPAGGSDWGAGVDPRERESLPLLQDVVMPPVTGAAERAGAEPPSGGPKAGSPVPQEDLPFSFELVPDEIPPGAGHGDLEPSAREPDGERYGDAPPPALDPEVYRHLVDRLANEIEVIIQTGTEEAMHRAAVDLADQVRDHVAIILPEVIEELVRLSSRTPGRAHGPPSSSAANI